MKLRAMTWNIHGGIGTDGRFDLGRVLAVIRRHAPDVLAVQEIDSRDRRHHPSAFTLLREAMPGDAVAAETLSSEDGAYGHMLLSRWPLRHVRRVNLSQTGCEPRSALEAEVVSPIGHLRVIATHLGLRWRERQRQARRLAALVRARPGPVVVLGDFNDWSWNGPVWRALKPHLPARTAHRTFPSRLPLLRLDEIFCRPAPLLGPNWRDTAAREASDHLPVIADLALDAVASHQTHAPAAQAPPSIPALMPQEA